MFNKFNNRRHMPQIIPQVAEIREIKPEIREIKPPTTVKSPTMVKPPTLISTLLPSTTFQLGKELTIMKKNMRTI